MGNKRIEIKANPDYKTYKKGITNEEFLIRFKKGLEVVLIEEVETENTEINEEEIQEAKEVSRTLNDDEYTIIMSEQLESKSNKKERAIVIIQYQEEDNEEILTTEYEIWALPYIIERITITDAITKLDYCTCNQYDDFKNTLLVEGHYDEDGIDKTVILSGNIQVPDYFISKYPTTTEINDNDYVEVKWYYDDTVVGRINFKVLSPSKIVCDTSGVKTTFLKDSAFNYNDLTITLTSYDEEGNEVKTTYYYNTFPYINDNFIVYPPNMNSIGTKEVVIETKEKYDGIILRITYPIKIQQATPISLEVELKSDRRKFYETNIPLYLYGETFSIENDIEKVYLVYADGSEEETTEYYLLNGDSIDTTSENVNTKVYQDVILVYNNSSIVRGSYQIAVKKVASITMDDSLVKKDYYKNEDFDTSSLILNTVVTTDDSTKSTKTFVLNNLPLEYYNITVPDMSNLGVNNIYVKSKYDINNTILNYQINIVEGQFIALEVPENIIMFNQDDTFIYDGLIVNYCENGESTPVTDYTVSVPNMHLAGEQLIAVTYHGYVNYYNIMINGEIAIVLDETMTKKEFIKNTNFDYTGLKVWSIQNTGEKVLLNNSNVRVTPPDLSTVGEKVVKVNHNNFSSQYIITVVNN